jgi:hypothetical protein
MKLCKSSSCLKGLILWFRPKDSDTAMEVNNALLNGKSFPKCSLKFAKNLCPCVLELELALVRIHGTAGEEQLLIESDLTENTNGEA